MSEFAGRPVRAIREEPRETSNGESVSPMSRMFDYYDEHGLLGNALTLRAILGREPRTLSAYVVELATANIPLRSGSLIAT